MKRYVPGLYGAAQNGDSDLEGLFLVRVDGASYRWHPQKPFFNICLHILEPKECADRTISGRLYSTPRALWKLSWFLRDFGYDTDPARPGRGRREGPCGDCGELCESLTPCWAVVAF